LMQVACQLLAPLGQAQRKPNSSVKRPRIDANSNSFYAMTLSPLILRCVPATKFYGPSSKV
jgi:hypothetical protein